VSHRQEKAKRLACVQRVMVIPITSAINLSIPPDFVKRPSDLKANGLITIRQLAQSCGVSTATVSLVLNDKDQGRVGPALRAKIQRAARRQGYRSNPIARGLVENRTYRIGIVLSGVLSDYAIIGAFSLYDQLGLAVERIHSAGYALELLQVDRRQPPKASDLLATRVDGFLFLGWPLQAGLMSLLAALKKNDRPVVVLATALETRSHTWVSADHYEFVRDAVGRFSKLGYREMAFVQTDSDDVYIANRRKIFVNTVAQELGQSGNAWLQQPQEFNHFGIVEAIEQLRQDHPGCRAFLLSDNFYADAVFTALRQTGLVPGRDCRVFGFGDTVLADRCSPRLSHYSLQSERQVQFAVTALLDWIAHPKTFTPICRLLPPEFLERET